MILKKALKSDYLNEVNIYQGNVAVCKKGKEMNLMKIAAARHKEEAREFLL